MSVLKTMNALSKKYIIAQLIIITVTAAAFFPSLSNGWTTWDDNEYVTDNEAVRSFSAKNIAEVFTNTYVGSYLPLTMISYMADYSIAGYDAQVFHRTNLILHIINAILFFWFVLLLTDDFIAAVLAALLFGIHPMRVESVAWISGRKDLLSMVFFLVSSIGYVFHQKNSKSYWLTFSFIMFVLAILSKIIVLTFPLILLLIDGYKKRDITTGSLIEKIPFVLVAAALSVIGFFGQISSKAVRQSADVVDNLIVSMHGVVFYLEKFFLPVNLSHVYPYPSELTAGYYLYAVLCVGICAVVWKYRNDSVIIFGFLFFLISLLPVLQLIRFSNIIAADRFTYGAYIGLFIIAGTFFSRAWEKYNRKILLFIVSIVLICFAILTWIRCGVWKESGTLWHDMLSKYPGWMQ